jgi:hypothetical protein
MLLPLVRGKLTRGATVVVCSLFSCTGMAIIGLVNHWAVAAFGMFLFGIGWTSAYATIQAAAQLVCPPWVRARALSIFQLAQNGALTIGSFVWGWVGGMVGLHHTFSSAAAIGLVLMVFARYARIEAIAAVPLSAPPSPAQGPEAPAAELVGLLRDTRGRVMETMHYRVAPEQRAEFLTLMQEARHVRGRAGALFWQVYEDVAHPDGWLEVWSMESWTDHLREATRLSEDDKQLLARLCVFQVETERPQRYLAVDPHTATDPASGMTRKAKPGHAGLSAAK